MKTFDIPGDLTDATLYEYSSRDRDVVFRARSRPIHLSDSQRQQLMDKFVEDIQSDHFEEKTIRVDVDDRQSHFQSLTVVESSKKGKKVVNKSLQCVYYGIVELDNKVTTELMGVFPGNARKALQEFNAVLKTIKKRDELSVSRLTIEEGDYPTAGKRNAGLVELQLPDEFVSHDQFILEHNEERMQLRFETDQNQQNDHALYRDVVVVPAPWGRSELVEQPIQYVADTLPPQAESTFSKSVTDDLLQKIRNSIR